MRFTLLVKPKWGSDTACFSVLFAHVCRKQPHHISRSHRGWPLLGQFLLQCVSSFRHTHHGRNEGTSNRLWTVRDGALQSVISVHEKAPQGSKSGCKSKGKKSKEGDSVKGKQVACKAVDSSKSRPRGHRRAVTFLIIAVRTCIVHAFYPSRFVSQMCFIILSPFVFSFHNKCSQTHFLVVVRVCVSARPLSVC